jgi:hypothetical protein
MSKTNMPIYTVLGTVEINGVHITPKIGKSANFGDKHIYDDEDHGFQMERILSSYIGGEHLFN